MKKAEVIVKWVTVGLMLLSVVMFLLPYRSNGSESMNGLEMVKATNGMHGSWLAEMIIRIIIPVVLMVVAGLLLIKTNLVTSIIAAICSLISFGIYSAYISDYRGDNYGTGAGLEINYIISILGIILPIAIIVLHKLIEKKEGQAPTQSA